MTTLHEFKLVAVRGGAGGITLKIEEALCRAQESGYRYITWTLAESGEMCLLLERKIQNTEEREMPNEETKKKALFGDDTLVAWQLPCFCSQEVVPAVGPGEVVPVVVVAAGYGMMMNVGEPAWLIDAGTGDPLFSTCINSIRKTTVSRLTPGDTWFMARMLGVEDNYDPQEVTQMYFRVHDFENNTPVSVIYVTIDGGC
jgi:hypothetical protein